MPWLNKIKKKLIVLGVFITCLALTLVIVDFYQKFESKAGLKENEILKTEKEKIVTFREAIDEEEKPVIVYQYISETKAEAETYQGLAEDMSKRTNNSQTFLKEVEPISETEQKETYVAKFYSGQAFAKDGEDWKYVETATTTPQAFAAQTKLTILDKAKEFFGQKVLAEIFYAGGGDGYILKNDAYTWDATHDATSGVYVYYNIPGLEDLTIASGILSGSQYLMERAFVPINTASLPSNAEIASASLKVLFYCGFACSNDDNDGDDFVTIVQTSQDSNTELVTGDYDQCGSINDPAEGIDATERKDITDLIAGGNGVYITFNLNTTGRSWIKKNGESSTCGSASGLTGWTCLGLREGHDVLDHPIIVSPKDQNNSTFKSSETSGTSQDPYLEITYIVPGKIRIENGKIRIN